MNNELHKLIETEQPNICQVVPYKGGVKLYTAYGFKHNGNFMQFTL